VSNDGTLFQGSGARPLFGSDLLSAVVATVSDIALLVEPSGRIRSAMANPDNRSFGEAAGWPGRNLSDLLLPESLERFRRRHAEMVAGAEAGDKAVYRWAELMHASDGTEGFPVRYSMHWMAQDELILMLGQDQRPVIEIQQQLLNAQIALERDYEAQREMDTRYRLLMGFTRDAIVLFSMATGRIIDLNNNAAALVGAARADLMGSPFAEQFEDRRTAEFLSALSNALPSDLPSPMQAVAARTQRRLVLHSKVFRAAGERLVLCRIEDPGQAGTDGSELSVNLRQLFYEGVDGIVFTNKDGIIEAASEAFLNLTDAPSLSSVRGRSMADFLARGAVDLKVLLETARRSGHLRVYATRLATDFDAQVSVEISATWLNDRADPILALVIRDASTSASLRSDMSLGGDSARGVMELVGSTTLKDIVAETTNVVEKICIETAIELTRNNRVAAAEMLGLSRQSLYVKLRKYGLLSRNEE